ncbi:hypothetical protein CEUSTIGMA_g8634.t1 [Chlamydomonas eustigma]|uniref:Phosphatidic acid phosphatase type 2/haloperoxidase domain-containing protein n=1 Tax=Chlamydomonas eustigma TaxID=1157962 RepID=A0A250XE75_9CHLO|nr:hypothetical protein CEUSTIGMA_g8634.t1 [Chlamydomonas eustigma]|eukprot:GAX81202.1 hypothetical protein CEUSTIGMA_g8634.t1 [Chlamydomonas eustigma]
MASLVGLVLNEVVARGLKHALKQPRPIDRCADLGTCSSYGSPSSHAQCMFFALAMYAALPLLQHHYPVNTQSPITQDYADAWFAKGSKRVFERVLHAVEMGGLALAAAAVGTSRVYLKYHSLDQVMLGAVLGILSGLIWATLMAAGAPFLGYFASAHPLGKVMSLRNSWGVLGVVAVEREAVHAAAGYKLIKGD